MSDLVPLSLYPIVVVQDRYQGVYSGGRWLAISNAKELVNAVPRASWVLENGPSSDDVSASGFWSDAPDWISSGGTADEAIDKLCLSFKMGIS